MFDECGESFAQKVKNLSIEIPQAKEFISQKALESSQSATSANDAKNTAIQEALKAREYRDGALASKNIAIQEASKAKSSEVATQRAKELTIEFANNALDYSNSAEFSALFASAESEKAKESETLAKGYLGQIDSTTTNYYKDISNLYLTNTNNLKQFVKEKEDSLTLFAKTTIDTIESQARDINQDKQEILIAKKETFDYALSSKDSSKLAQGYANSASEAKNVATQKANEAKSSEASANSSKIEAITARDIAVQKANEIHVIKGDLDVKCAFLKMDGASSYDIKKELYTFRTGSIYEMREKTA